MRDWDIKHRVLFLALLPGTLIGLMLYAYFVNNQLQLIEQSLHERGKTIAEQLAPASEYGVITGNTELLARLTSTILKSDDVIGITITDANNLSLLKVGTIRGYQEHVESSSSSEGLCYAGRHSLVFCHPIEPTRLQVSDFGESTSLASGSQNTIGWVFVELSTQDLDQRRRQIILQALIITFSVLLVTGYFAARFARQISEPIVQLTGTVEEVARGNLNASIPETASSEIRTLQNGVNAMIAALRSSQADMQSRIDKATNQLRATLLDLEKKNQDLEKQRKRAQEASKAKSLFLANMSHEIRTPLSGIMGMLDLLKDTPLRQTQKNYVDNLALATKSLHTLIDDILDLSRIESGKLTLLPQEVEIWKVIEEVVQMLAPAAHKKGLELTLLIEPDLPQLITIDSLRLRQILINLTANAIKFTEHGEVSLSVVLSPKPDGGGRTLRFEIEDTGIGIPYDKQQLIFESFTQADTSNTRKYGGTGLGTTISRELVGLMGGNIGLQSQEGKGSLFWVELPLADNPDEPQAADVYKLVMPCRLLILEAHEPSRIAAARYGAILGCETEFFTTTDELVEALRGLPPASPECVIVLLAENSAKARRTDLARRLRHEFAELEPRLCHLTFFNGKSSPTLFDDRLNKPLTLSSLRHYLLSLEHEANPEALETEPASPLKPLRILVAEDNKINALVICRLLEKAGHHITLATNGAEALEKLAAEAFDLTLMDMRMPQMDGLEATRLWRERETGQMPIIALTANATVEDREQCLAAGMDDFLAKPVDEAQLTEILRRYFGEAGN